MKTYYGFQNTVTQCFWSDKCAVLPLSLRRRLAAGFTVAAELCDTQAAAPRGVHGCGKPSVPTAAAAAECGPHRHPAGSSGTLDPPPDIQRTDNNLSFTAAASESPECLTMFF